MRCAAAGLSLVELLIALAISALLLVLSAPAFLQARGNAQLQQALNDFLADFRFARLEAMRLGDVVVLCRVASAAASECEATASARGWADGWVVGHDRNRNQRIDADEVLRRHEGWPVAVSVSDSRGTARPIQLAPAGRLLNLSSATTLRFTGDRSAQGSTPLCVSISVGARTQALQEADCP
jgi:type IV fimbrial biogenesis protein FimT